MKRISSVFNKRDWLIVLLTASLFSVFILLLPPEYRENESTDYLNYYLPVAQNIVRGQGMTVLDGSPAVRYPPGYPLLLAGMVALGEWTGIPLELLSGAGTFIFLSLAGLCLLNISVSEWGAAAGRVTPLLFLTYPFVLWLAKQPNSEIPFMAALYAGFYLFWRGLQGESTVRLWFFSAGTLLGFAMLIRPIAIGLGFLFAVLLLFAVRFAGANRLRYAMFLLLGNLVVVLPWLGWMYAHTGKLLPLSTGGSYSVFDGFTYAVGTDMLTDLPADVQEFQLDLYISGSELGYSKEVFHLVVRKFSESPVAFGKLMLIKAARSWYATESGRLDLIGALIQAFYVALIAVSGIVSWKKFPQKRRLLLGVCLIALYFWGMTISALSIVRYMTPAIGLLFLFVPALLVTPSGWIPIRFRARFTEPH